ncbi:IrrE N-terminal-like domain-containing protein [Lactobacillus phage P185]|nr:IrrE N-terminal-like domain-containing protein [Lactobacillus phage P185]
MVINLNWHNQSELPFIIGHEIGHFILGDKGVLYYSSFSGQNSEEKSADLYSLNLLYNYACSRGQYFEEPGQFLSAYGIPFRMTDATKELFKRNDN